MESAFTQVHYDWNKVLVALKGYDGVFKVTLTGTFVNGEVECTASLLLQHEADLNHRAVSLCPQ